MSDDTAHQQQAAHASTEAHDQDHGTEEDHDTEKEPERARKVSTALLDKRTSKSKGGKQGKAKAAPATGELEVKESVVKLGTGSPRDQIQEHVGTMVAAWNSTLINLSVAAEQFVGTVQYSQVQAAAPGLMKALWTKVEPLIVQAAGFVTGGTLGATIGLEAVKRLIAHSDALERQRVQTDSTAFIHQLRATVAALKQKTPLEGGSPSINKAVSKLDSDFEEVGKANSDDAYKSGDRGVVGAQAAFLKDLQQNADNYSTNVPTQESFVASFLQEWIVHHHKKRNRSAMRSPFEGATYQDGYIELTTQMDYDNAWAGLYMVDGVFATSKLHCPKSNEVAESLKQTVPNFSLDALDVPITINVEFTEGAWQHMPAHWKNQRTRTVHIMNGMVTGGAKEWWTWAMQETRKSTREILQNVHKLEG